MELEKAIRFRKSTREFSNKKPDWREIIECIDTMCYAPMAGGIFSLKFILISDKEKIQKIADACQQDFVGTVDYLLVVCSYKNLTINSYGKRGERYLRQQAGAAIQNFLLAVEEKGLATCWIGDFNDMQIKRELKIPEEIEIEAVFPIGYASSKRRKKKVRISLDSCLYFDKYKNKRMGK